MILKKLFGYHDIKITGNMHTETLLSSFEKEFGTKIRVYKPTKDGAINTGKGSKHAPSDVTLASISILGSKLQDITISKNKTVGQIEEDFEAKLGIGIQVMSPDGKSFAPNNLKLKDVSGFFS
jgi:hypothetical protein